MKFRQLCMGAFVLCALASSGCGTIITLIAAPSNERMVYSGTELDFKVLRNDIGDGGVPWPLRIISVLDMPLSFVADTLILPYTFFTGDNSFADSSRRPNADEYCREPEQTKKNARVDNEDASGRTMEALPDTAPHEDSS